MAVFGEAFEIAFWLQTILFPPFPPRHHVLFSHDKETRLSKWSEPASEATIHPLLSWGEETMFWLVADMKEEHRILFVISLISIISAVWMNFKWFARSYLCYHRRNMSAVLCSALNCGWGGRGLNRADVSALAARWRNYSSSKTRLSGDREL